MNQELKTFTGEVIPETTRGLIYLCDYSHKGPGLRVIHTKLYKEAYDAKQSYWRPQEPHSLLVVGETWEEFKREVIALHKRMGNPNPVKQIK